MLIFWQCVIPVITKSEFNIWNRWQTYRRFKDQEESIKKHWLLDQPKVELPCSVRLVRISPRMLDDDNLRGSALKHCRDTIADLIIPGLPKGRADSDPRIKWEYDQRKGSMSLEITIYQDQSQESPSNE